MNVYCDGCKSVSSTQYKIDGVSHGNCNSGGTWHEVDTYIPLLESRLTALEQAARDARDGLSALHAFIVLNHNSLTATEAEVVSQAIRSKNALARLLPANGGE